MHFFNSFRLLLFHSSHHTHSASWYFHLGYFLLSVNTRGYNNFPTINTQKDVFLRLNKLKKINRRARLPRISLIAIEYKWRRATGFVNIVKMTTAVKLCLCFSALFAIASSQPTDIKVNTVEKLEDGK